MGKSVLIRFQTDNFRSILLNKRTNDKLPLHDEQTVNGFRKIALASVVHFPFDVSTSMSPCLHTKMETANFRLFGAKRQRKTDVCFPWSTNDKQ
jgi:hypothetical protein